MALTGPATPQITRLATAAARRPGDDAERFLLATAARVDSVSVRVTLAKTVIALRSDGLIDEYLAAAALLDLDDSDSPLTHAAILGALRLILRETASAPPRRARRTDPAHV